MMDKVPKQSENLGGNSNLFQALRLVGFTTGYIFGPMIIFGAVGWWLSQRFNSLIYLFVALFIALIVSNILIFKSAAQFSKRIQNRK